MEIGGHIRVHPHMTYHLGAAKLMVTGGQNVIFWHFRAVKYTNPLNSGSVESVFKSSRCEYALDSECLALLIAIKVGPEYPTLLGLPISLREALRSMPA